MKQDDKDIEVSYKKGFHNGSDAHKLDTAKNSISLLFEKYDGLVGKMEQLKEVIQPKPPTMLTVIGGIASIIVILATLVGTVVNITKSSIAPINAKIEQINELSAKLDGLNTQLHILDSEFKGAEKQINHNKTNIDWFQKGGKVIQRVYQNTEKINATNENIEVQFKAMNKYFEGKINDLNELIRSKTMKGKK